MDIVKLVKESINGKNPEASLITLSSKFAAGEVALSTSFSAEDQVLSHIIFSNNLPIRVFTLDTGRLFPETYSVWNDTIRKYGKTIEAFYPETTAVEQLVSTKGPYSFYESITNRLECCHIRKVEPLFRALKGVRVWLTGIRREHSESRQQLESVEWDERNKVVKFHPLLDWTNEEVWNFIQKNHVPYNILYTKGFKSIGCQPCTRAVGPEEPPRAGRWWWEQNHKKECGLHTHR